MSNQTNVVYWDYLHLIPLLGLQGGLDGDDSNLSEDEVHFITVHQIFELWFKLLLREIRMARDEMAASCVAEQTIPKVTHHLRRVSQILKVATHHWQVVETLTPQDFLAFRGKLGDASGGQSFQLREIELVMGLWDERRDDAQHGPIADLLKTAERSVDAASVRLRLEAAQGERSLRSAVHEWLYRTPIQGSDPTRPGDGEVVSGFIEEYLAGIAEHHEGAIRNLLDGERDLGEVREDFARAHAKARQFLEASDAPGDGTARARLSRIRAGVLFIESYRTMPLLAWPRTLLDTLVDVDENLVLWRTSHARMVERIIGRRIGTGGTSGVDYLDQTTKYRIFPELWEVRTILLPEEYLPALQHADRFRFLADCPESS